MAKHGAEAHFVRPDGVYRTSVLQAIPGYQPVSNAYEVAARFTAAPYFATSVFSTPSGLGRGLSQPNSALPGLLGFSRPTLLGLGATSHRMLARRALRGLNGPLSPWEQYKLRWTAWIDRMRAKAAAKKGGPAAAAIAALAPAVAKPDGSVVAALPDVSSKAPEAVDYGQGPAREGMARVGAAITSGAVQSGSDALVPRVAVTASASARDINPQTYATPGDMASWVKAGVPPFIGDRAYQAAMNRWNGLRNQWWWNLS